jgi:hypothetical protein
MKVLRFLYKSRIERRMQHGGCGLGEAEYIQFLKASDFQGRPICADTSTRYDSLRCNTHVHMGCRCSIQAIWDLWWDGNKTENIQPYRYIRGIDLCKEDTTILSKTKFIINRMVDLSGDSALGKRKLNEDEVTRMPTRDRDQLVSALLVCLIKSTCPDNKDMDINHLGDLHMTTLYDIVKDYDRLVFGEHE